MLECNYSVNCSVVGQTSVAVFLQKFYKKINRFMNKEQEIPKFCQRCKKPVDKSCTMKTHKGQYIAMCKECQKWYMEQMEKMQPLMQKFFRR